MANKKVGTKTGKKTTAGKDVYKTPEGESVSEKSVTIKFGENAYVNAPSIHDGVEYSEDEIKQMLMDGKIKPTSRHDTLEEALEAAQERSNTLMNEGGMAIEKQMEMFEDGGLMQEGGTVDPVSGNDVPVGSTQEEVRDDIPAQLSEGEFVFPADVVRFYGLEKLMEMRQRAKAGLRMMEDMGQMGNSEEAILPDDIPFDLEDLDIEEEDEYNNTMEMQVGGFVQPQGFTGIQTMQPSAFQNYQPQYVPYQAPTVPTTYQPVQQQAVPTFTGQVPKVEDFLKTPQPGEQDLRKYVNDEGQVRMIPFVNDQPIYPIPQGFYPEAEKPVEEEAPTAVTTETAKVVDRGGRDFNDTTPGATMSFGGKVNPATGLVENATMYSVSYPDAIPSIATIAGLVTGNTALSDLIGDQVAITNQNTNQTITMSKTQYAEIKADPRSNETMQMLSDMEEAAAAGVAKGDTEADVNNAISLLGETYGFATPKGMTMEEAIAQVAKAERAGNKGITGKKPAQQTVSIKGKKVPVGYKPGEVDPGLASAAAAADPYGGKGPGDTGSPAGAGGPAASGATGAAAGADSMGNAPRAKGGLIEKPKPKKMKRGGLASKK